jgi:hypothetical protein
MDKTAFSVVSSFEEAEAQDNAYWWAQTPQARLEALELMRQVAYGYDPNHARIERVLEVVQRSEVESPRSPGFPPHTTLPSEPGQ